MSLDSRELDLPETTFTQNIEDAVFIGIVSGIVNEIDGVALVEKGGRWSEKPLSVRQGNHTVAFKLVVSVDYGAAIPEKSRELQEMITQKVTHLTGIHVASVDIVFKTVAVKK